MVVEGRGAKGSGGLKGAGGRGGGVRLGCARVKAGAL